jgi:hypothetical protein
MLHIRTLTNDKGKVSSSRPAISRLDALKRIVFLYLVIQLISYIILQQACSPSVYGDVWLHGALGPFAAIKTGPRFHYHSLLSNIGFLLVCLVVLVTPLAYLVRPGRATLVVSIIGLVIWCVFGLGFSINHL